jgi:uroporphyrinogen-III decarboxylase
MLVDAGVTMVEPLESPPSGDVTLAEVRKSYGSRLVLKGNVNTFQTLARGTPAMVMAEARQCVRDAGAEGFILSSADQVAGDTPEENFRALIDAVEQV